MVPQIEDTALYREIHQQPDVLRQLFKREKERVDCLADEMTRRGIASVMIAARGTSDNAARYAQYLLGARNRIPVALATPSLFTIYQSPPRVGNALVLGISQSGKSPDIITVLAEARSQGALTAAITNDPTSEITHVADHVINLEAGLEVSVAATKTYTAELGAIALLSSLLAGGKWDEEILSGIPDSMARTLASGMLIAGIAQRYRYMKTCVVIGRGYNYATAFEMALKLKELTYTQVEAYSSADFLHGPLALIEDGFPIFVVAPSGAMLPEMKQFASLARERRAEVIAISDDPEMLSLAQVPVMLPDTVEEAFSPLTTIIPAQLLSMYLAHARFIDVDHPRGIRKVTETW